ncbi:MAG TPA: ROK family protein [Bacteroidales bacterium]|nr:ROK family protein [Bacteroidales bacterium]HPT21076.1 ROK family protein [Bacteroidales bacterium]
MKKNLAIGTDIGGSHITCAAVDLVSGKILRDTVSERAVDNKAQASAIISIWAEALSEALSKISFEDVKGIGFAMPGPFDYVKGISYIRGVAKYENLYGFNISYAISKTLGVPGDFLVRFMNDASSFAVGEAWAGSASKVNSSLSITLGTGFGSAFIRNRIPIVDGPDVPKLGCVYHLPYKDGIADDTFSTRGLLGKYKNLKGKELSGVKELAALAPSDKAVADLFTEFGDGLGLFLAPWLKRFGAEMLVIGGNISYAYNIFGDALEKRLKEENCNSKVAISKLKEDAAIIGSAYLLDDGFWKSVQHALPLM